MTVGCDSVGSNPKNSWKNGLKKEEASVVASVEADGSVRPMTMHASVGQSVKWLNLIPVDDDGGGYVDIKLADGSAASPTMVQNDIWSHTFDRPGTYTYHVTSRNFPTLESSETVEVSLQLTILRQFGQYLRMPSDSLSAVQRVNEYPGGASCRNHPCRPRLYAKKA